MKKVFENAALTMALFTAASTTTLAQEKPMLPAPIASNQYTTSRPDSLIIDGTTDHSGNKDFSGAAFKIHVPSVGSYPDFSIKFVVPNVGSIFSYMVVGPENQRRDVIGLCRISFENNRVVIYKKPPGDPDNLDYPNQSVVPVDQNSAINLMQAAEKYASIHNQYRETHEYILGSAASSKVVLSESGKSPDPTAGNLVDALHEVYDDPHGCSFPSPPSQSRGALTAHPASKGSPKI